MTYEMIKFALDVDQKTLEWIEGPYATAHFSQLKKGQTFLMFHKEKEIVYSFAKWDEESAICIDSGANYCHHMSFPSDTPVTILEKEKPMNKHLTLPNDSAIILHFNKDAQWVTAANGAILQMTPVADTGVPAGGYIKPGHQTEVMGRHVLLEISEVGTCDTLITQLTRVRNHLEKNGQEAKKAHIEALARQLAEAQHEYRMAYGVPDQGPNHAHNFDNLRVEAPVTAGAVNGGYPEDMVKLARELNEALENSK